MFSIFCGEAISILNLRKSRVLMHIIAHFSFQFSLIFRSTDDERCKGVEGGVEARAEAGTQVGEKR